MRSYKIYSRSTSRARKTDATIGGNITSPIFTTVTCGSAAYPVEMATTETSCDDIKINGREALKAVFICWVTDPEKTRLDGGQVLKAVFERTIYIDKETKRTFNSRSEFLQADWS